MCFYFLKIKNNGNSYKKNIRILRNLSKMDNEFELLKRF